jgi:hypothetical protein
VETYRVVNADSEERVAAAGEGRAEQLKRRPVGCRDTGLQLLLKSRSKNIWSHPKKKLSFLMNFEFFWFRFEV